MARTRKIRRGRAVFEQLLAERDREGLTWTALSARSGVPISTLQRWSRRLREESRPAFIEVGSVSVATPVFEVDLAGGRRLRIPMRFDPDALRTLVGVLDATC